MFLVHAFNKHFGILICTWLYVFEVLYKDAHITKFWVISHEFIKNASCVHICYLLCVIHCQHFTCWLFSVIVLYQSDLVTLVKWNILPILYPVFVTFHMSASVRLHLDVSTPRKNSFIWMCAVYWCRRNIHIERELWQKQTNKHWVIRQTGLTWHTLARLQCHATNPVRYMQVLCF